MTVKELRKYLNTISEIDSCIDYLEILVENNEQSELMKIESIDWKEGKILIHTKKV